MADKATKIDDVKRSDKVAAEATSRPLLVGNRPTVMTDPMMAPPSGDAKPEGTAAVPLAHTTKLIKPVTVTSDQGEASQADPAGKIEEGPAATEEQEKQPEPNPVPPTPVDSTASPQASRLSFDSSGDESTGVKRDLEATNNAEGTAVNEAKSKRDIELEGLIASGKYAVPINAVQRKRSRTNAILLCVVAVLLAIVLIDLVADVGVLSLPNSIPHTHFFQKH